MSTSQIVAAADRLAAEFGDDGVDVLAIGRDAQDAAFHVRDPDMIVAIDGQARRASAGVGVYDRFPGLDAKDVSPARADDEEPAAAIIRGRDIDWIGEAIGHFDQLDLRIAGKRATRLTSPLEDACLPRAQRRGADFAHGRRRAVRPRASTWN